MKTRLDETNFMRRLMGLSLLNEQESNEQKPTRDPGERTDLIMAITEKLKGIEGDANLYNKPYTNSSDVTQADIAYEAYIGGWAVADWGQSNYLKNNTYPDSWAMDVLLWAWEEWPLDKTQKVCEIKPLLEGYKLLIGKTSVGQNYKLDKDVYYVQPPNNGDPHLSVGDETVYQNELLKVFKDLILPGYRQLYSLICQPPTKTWAKSDGSEDITGTEMV